MDNRRLILAAIAGIGILFGIVLNTIGVDTETTGETDRVECGSVFAPDNNAAREADRSRYSVNNANAEDDCSSARTRMGVFGFGGMSIGALAAIGALMLPGGARANSSTVRNPGVPGSR